MHGSSGDSLTKLNQRLVKVLGDDVDGAKVAESLFAASDVLREQVALRRAVTDPSMEGRDKAKLAKAVFGEHLDATATDLTAAAAELRWASSRDLPQALDQLGVVAVVKSAEGNDEGDRLEGELFSFGRAVADNPTLRDALSDPARTVADKQELVRSLLQRKAAKGTVMLAQRAVSGAHLTVSRALEEYVEIAAAARDRLVAEVRVAAPLTDDEKQRLDEVLARQYDRPVHLNMILDPDVIGGVRVEIGDQVIDGTISSRIDEARRQLAG
ncbi:MAG: F0F1 ATP synthase subunit delta [Actinomycetota bacterium]|nr:F0F1 ATP synthase subunit delta [Actinomycetota bacterium]